MTITPTLYRIRIANYLYKPKNTKKQKCTFYTYHRDNNNHTYLFDTACDVIFGNLHSRGIFAFRRYI